MLRDLPDARVSAFVTDPPYSSGGAFRGDRVKETTAKYVSTKPAPVRVGGDVSHLSGDRALRRHLVRCLARKHKDADKASRSVRTRSLLLRVDRAANLVDEVLATVAFGAEVELRARIATENTSSRAVRESPTPEELWELLGNRGADALFRRASGALASGAAAAVPTAKVRGFLSSASELARVSSFPKGFETKGQIGAHPTRVTFRRGESSFVSMRVDENHRVLRFAGALAAVHLLLNGAHGAAHGNLGIAAPPGSEAFIVLVIIAGPLLGVGLALRWRAVGALTLGLSMFAALVFGVAYHFVIDSVDRCDHVGHGSWAGAFQATAVLLAATELLGVATAVRLGRTSAPSRSVGRTGVLLVDGTCVFCNRLVQWILRHDAEGYFRFAHIQGDFARAAFARHRIGVPDLDRVYVLQDEGGPKERVLIDGEAARLIYPVILGSAGLVVFFVPMAILNVFYRVFAAVRYRIFGQASSCIVPDADQRQRFIGATSGE